MYTQFSLRPIALALCSATLLAACGGGGSTGESPAQTTGLSNDQVIAYSANASYVPADTTEAAAATLTATKAVVASGQAGQTINCGGGGTAVYTVTGGSLASVTNGVLDAGETYSLVFTDCKGAPGLGAINGSLGAAVETSSASGVKVNMTNNGVTVALPRRQVRLSGASTIEQSVATSAAGTVTTNRFTAGNISAETTFGARKSTFSLSNVDMVRAITVNNNVVTATSYNGTATLSATLPNGAFSLTTATQGAATFSADGTPQQGTWVTTLPNYKLTLKIASGSATIEVDQGADGTVDRTVTITTGNLESSAG
ncbi:MAG: hypothetical protein RL341_2455 [Pseudomonadota bacterium]|jgi:hypothetical protein